MSSLSASLASSAVLLHPLARGVAMQAIHPRRRALSPLRPLTLGRLRPADPTPAHPWPAASMAWPRRGQRVDLATGKERASMALTVSCSSSPRPHPSLPAPCSSFDCTRAPREEHGR
jgi:hypothetical protein